tara:strand:- start:2585 stop:3877 length:1293 start_codon:yes stop_codon:yes gene_type:complete
MNKLFWFLCYNLIFIPILYVLIKFLAFYKPKLRESIENRKKLWSRLESKISERKWEKPLIWLHVASAGEYLQAKPVIKSCIENGAECLLTYSSINAFKWIKNENQSKINGLLTTEFLPFDSIKNARRLVGLIQPSRMVWISYDLWPNLIWELNFQRIPQSLISAIVHENSLRTKFFLGRSFYKSIYSCLEHILTVSEDDSMRILSANPEHGNIKVMGEIRCDSVIERRNSLEIPELPRAKKAGFVFIAASTWPKDEKCIFPGLKEALNTFPELFLVVAPHEPTEKYLRNSERFFKDFNLERFSRMKPNNNENRILLIDSIGVLAGLYYYANMVYIGGSFTTGVHNILEPASMKSKICFGPKYSNSREAIEMVKQKLAFSINSKSKFNKLLFDSLSNKEDCEGIGRKSCIFIENQIGATNFCLPFLMKNIT